VHPGYHATYSNAARSIFSDNGGCSSLLKSQCRDRSSATAGSLIVLPPLFIVAYLLILPLIFGALIWISILLAPWSAWSTREYLDAPHTTGDEDLSDVTVLIPARNEAEHIGRSLHALSRQGSGLRIIIVDDQSTDDTVRAARNAKNAKQTIVAGAPLPTGWSGKLWALEQGRGRVATELTLLLDADIELRPGIIAAACTKLRADRLDAVSLLAAPRLHSLWERLLMPAFVYFFKLLYPFRLCASPRSRMAAAAGGFFLIKTEMLTRIGGFSAIKDELIDDCALARCIKSTGGKIWLGLSHDARMLRANRRFVDIWHMVARTAFTQLNYSSGWLGVCTLIMVVAFWAPVLALLYRDAAIHFAALTILTFMMATYLPILKFYGRSPAWALTMPLIGLLYLAMTWGSAIGYWRGRRACWKGRLYCGKPAS
jgi:hopene-associated glycosyltransferase HpnB